LLQSRYWYAFSVAEANQIGRECFLNEWRFQAKGRRKAELSEGDPNYKGPLSTLRHRHECSNDIPRLGHNVAAIDQCCTLSETLYLFLALNAFGHGREEWT
jgi:hypothetical protein